MEKTTKRKAYCDTGAFIAFLERSDKYHQTFAKLFADPPQLVTSALVIQEGHGWLLKRYGIRQAIQFLDFIHSLQCLTIRSVGADEIQNAAKLIRSFPDQALTLCDAIGLVMIKHLTLKVCWSTDRHLALTGAHLVIHQ